jgi:S-formylglutathione hydrolase FrmB
VSSPGRLASAALLLAALGAAAGTPPAPATALARAVGRADPANAHVSLHSAHGVHVKAVKRIGSRQLRATIRPRALARVITVRILLPVGYDKRGERRYPVLYLYPGTSGHSSDWMTIGKAPGATRRYPLITVSSDIGINGDGGGWFTNWVDRKTKLGPSRWETYDIDELIPWIDANLATIRSRAGRAVAGLSQGGYGSTELAARHPDVFTQMGSFSGAPEIDRDPGVRLGASLIIAGTMWGLNGVEPDAPFGPHGDDEINWRGHDPAYLIPNLRGVGLWFATADGLPGKYDDPVLNPVGVTTTGGIESLTHVSTDRFLVHLRNAGVPATVYDYGSGTHTWRYWARDLRLFLKVAMHRFTHPAPTPATAHYLSIEPRWRQWGWSFRDHRRHPLQFASLTGATVSGFTLRGAGRAVVRTPAAYRGGRFYRVLVGHRAERLRASRAGRLRVTVPLGHAPRRVEVRIFALGH